MTAAYPVLLKSMAAVQLTISLIDFVPACPLHTYFSAFVPSQDAV